MTVAQQVDVCRFTAASSGTGDFVVSAAVLGYQTPASALAVSGSTYHYRAESADLTQWEIGQGVYTSAGTTLARTTILFSSTGAKVSFTAAPQVALVALAEDLVMNTTAPITNSLGADVLLNNTANYFDGPSCAQGTTGTWFATGQVTVQDTAGTATFDVKLWDGTTVINSTEETLAVNFRAAISLSGVITNPTGNIRISVKDLSSTSGLIRFNLSGNSKDSTLTVLRIA